MVRKYHLLSFFGNRISYFVIFLGYVCLFFFFKFFVGVAAGQPVKRIL